MSLTRGLVLDVANQVGGTMPSIVTLHDWSREKNEGAITAVTWAQLGSTGQWVMEFDGATTYTTHADKGFPSGAEDRTFLAWLNRGATAATDRLFGYGTWGADEAFDCCVVQTGALELIGHTNNYQSTGTPSTQGVWQLLAFVLLGGTIYFYVDGVEDSNFATTIDTTLSGTAYIGCSIAGVTQNDLLGDLTKGRLLNYALTPAQIRAFYHSTKWLFGVAS